MRERGGGNESITQHVKRFFETPEKAQEEIERIIADEPEIDKSELYRRLSSTKGVGKPHVSKYQDDRFDYQLRRRK